MARLRGMLTSWLAEGDLWRLQMGGFDWLSHVGPSEGYLTVRAVWKARLVLNLAGTGVTGQREYWMFHGKPVWALGWQADYSLEDQRGLGRPGAGHRLPRRGQRRRYPVDPYASRAAARGVLGPGPV